MRRLLALTLPILAIACDSPGSGGGGGLVDCTRTPDLPVCRPDVTDTNQPDTSADTIANADTFRPGDTTGPTDATVPPQDTTQPDIVLPPECSGTATRCVDNQAQTCSGGSWVTFNVCGGSTTCQNGACVPTSTCTNGQRRCGTNTVELCSAGQWTTEQNCADGCSNNQCNQPSMGNLACIDVFECTIDAGCFDAWPTAPSSACMSPCLDQGSTLGRTEMNAVLSCYASCNYDDACIIDTCYQQRANCFFDTSGSLSCLQIDECIGGCTSGGNCVINCYSQGTNAAQGQYVRVNDCLNSYCAANDQVCWGQVISPGGPCEQAFDICFPQ